jgi:uncharacterized protein YdeI (YjbR/CyaY-like superfamily)
MEIGDTLYVHRRADWRRWLQKHFRRTPDVWLVLPNKASGRPSLLYNDAVEEALCVGWIDSIRKKLDAGSAVQRYSPRRPRSPYSQQNVERLRWLLENGLVHRDVTAAAEAAVARPFVFPKEVMAALRKHPEGWQWFRRQSGPYQRIRVWWVDAARAQPKAFGQRLNALIEACKARKIVGSGGIDKYF